MKTGVRRDGVREGRGGEEVSGFKNRNLTSIFFILSPVESHWLFALNDTS